jgi:hypothetical protein
VGDRKEGAARLAPMTVRILTSALDDLTRGRAFYEKQGEGLGSYFFDSVFSDIDSLTLYAGIHRKAVALRGIPENAEGVLSISPGLRPGRYPGFGEESDFNPARVGSRSVVTGMQPCQGWGAYCTATQGSASRATLS